MPSKSQLGFAPILIVILLAIIAGSLVLVVKNISFNQPKQAPIIEKQSTDSAQLKTTPTPPVSKAPTITTSKKPTPIPTKAPTGTTTNGSNNSSPSSSNNGNSSTPTNPPTPTPTPAQAPPQATIIEFSPRQAYNNEVVTIFGSSLGTSGNVIFEGKFSGTPVGDFSAEIVSWESFRIKVKVPPGNYNTARLKVQTSSGQTLTLTDDAFNNFTFIHSGY